MAQPLVLSHLGNRDLSGRSPREPVQRIDCGTPDHAVVGKADILLELLDRLLSSRPENAVDPVRIEAELAEPPLELRHIIATHHRGAVVEEPITEAVVSLHESVPRLRSADPVNHQAAVTLKAAQRRLGLGAEFLSVSVGAVADQSQPALEIANGVACIAAAKRQTVGLPSPRGPWRWSRHASNSAPDRD